MGANLNLMILRPLGSVSSIHLGLTGCAEPNQAVFTLFPVKIQLRHQSALVYGIPTSAP